MKKQIFSIVVGLTMILTTATSYAENKTPIVTPQQKAVKSFNKEFNNSVVPTVYLTDGGFILKAISDGHNVTSAYNNKGNWVYTIKLYPSESLSVGIIDIIQNAYNTKGYYITAMKKIDQPGNSSVYLVDLQNSSSFKTLRVANNEVEEMLSLKKV